jgi:hypothetical protein
VKTARAADEELTRTAGGRARGLPAWPRLALIELRHLARSPLLWIGVALSAYLATRAIAASWPTLTGDDGRVYHEGATLAPFVLLAGAWVGLRDRRTRASELIASSPSRPGTLKLARLAAIAAVAAGAFAMLFCFGLLLSVARGGHGVPDGRLLLDGVLAAILAGWIGFALGSLTRSVVVALLAAPIYAFIALYMGDGPTVESFRPSVEWLSPVPALPDRSVAYGFFPDILRLHLLFVLGLVALTGSLVVALAPDGWRPRRVSSRAVAVAVGGLLLAGSTGAGLLAKPDSLLPNGPNPALWQSEHHIITALQADRPFPFPDDGRATACATGRAFTACVYPAYGSRMASLIASKMEREAELLQGFPGAPTKLRMVPAENIDCIGTDGAMTFPEGNASLLTDPYFDLRGLLTRCVLQGEDPHLAVSRGPTDAQAAVELWLFLQIGEVPPARVEAALVPASPPIVSCQPGGSCTSQATSGFGETCDPSGVCHPVVEIPNLSWDGTPAAARAALAMDAVPPDQVRASLAAVWDSLRAGTLTLKDLPGST